MRCQPCFHAQVSPGEGALITAQALTQEAGQGLGPRTLPHSQDALLMDRPHDWETEAQAEVLLPLAASGAFKEVNLTRSRGLPSTGSEATGQGTRQSYGRKAPGHSPGGQG